MAQLHPDKETIKRLKPEPWEGEERLVRFLNETLKDDWEIYFQPFLNGDKPDIVLLRKDYGALIIEVKDWELEKYSIKNNKWILKHNQQIIKKSPIDQVSEYKNNFFNLHIPGLLQKKIKESQLYGIIQTQVYFHKETQEALNKWTKDRFIAPNPRFCALIGNDSLNESKYQNIVNGQRLNAKKPHFDEQLYKEFKRFLQPPLTVLEKGSNNLKLNHKQKRLAESASNKQQKIKGIAGSGKTFVLAQRAVNSHLRHAGRVLILTYNITLRNYIHDHISNVRSGLDWKNFYVMHYHGFFKIEANNYEKELKLNSFEDIDFFKDAKDRIIKFEAIFIDEIQDYKSEWIQIIKKYFLADDGEFVVFGDEKQNIYHRELSQDATPNTTIPGKWALLTDSYRFSNKIVPLLNRFQKKYFKETYWIDSITSLRQQEMFVEESIQYIPVSKDLPISSLVTQIDTIMKENNTHPNDACILGSTVAVLRGIDLELRKRRQKTMVTFEDKETFDLIMAKKELKGYSHDEAIEGVRRNKKLNFWMNPGTIKLSTIHSFKGWEISSLFLLINPKEDNDELIYTAITRCRHNLFIINIENERYGDFFNNNIKDASPINQLKANTIPIGKALEEKNIEKDLAFDAIVQGMKALGWMESPKEATDNKKDDALNAIFMGIKDLGWDANLSEIANQNSNQTIDEITTKEKETTNSMLKRGIKPLLEDLRDNHRKYKILIIGQLACEKKKVEDSLNKYFHTLGLSQNDWQVDFCIKTKDIKNYNLKTLKKGQSGYSLVATGNIPQHQTTGNEKGNIISSLSQPGFVPIIKISRPKDRPTIEQIIHKLEEYFLEQLEKIRNPNIVDYY